MTSDQTALHQPGGSAPAPATYNPNEFWLRTLLRWYIGLIIRPSPTIREIVERRLLWAGVGSLWGGITASLLSSLVAIISVDGSFSSTSEMPNVFGVLLDPAAIAGYCVASMGMLGLWVYIMHLVALRLGGTGTYSATLLGMIFASADAAIALAIVMLGLGIIYFDAQSALSASNAFIVVALVVVLAAILWGNFIATRVAKVNYGLDTSKTILVVTVCGIPTFVFGLAAMIGWVWSLFGLGVMLNEATGFIS